MAEVIIRVLDLETNGLAPPAEVLEIGWRDVLLNDGEVTIGDGGHRLFGHTQPLDPVARAAHHLTPQELVGCPLFASLDLAEIFAGDGSPPDCYAAHNAAFESQWLTGVRMICTMKAAARAWPDAPSRGNSALRYWLNLDLDDAEALPAHRAGPDAYVTAHILRALLEAGITGKDMLRWTAEPLLLTACPIDGRNKEKGKGWPDVTHGLLTWIVGTPDLGEDLKWNAQRELDRRSVARG